MPEQPHVAVRGEGFEGFLSNLYDTQVFSVLTHSVCFICRKDCIEPE